jgi:hypothetical protein
MCTLRLRHRILWKHHRLFRSCAKAIDWKLPYISKMTVEHIQEDIRRRRKSDITERYILIESFLNNNNNELTPTDELASVFASLLPGAGRQRQKKRRERKQRYQQKRA